MTRTRMLAAVQIKQPPGYGLELTYLSSQWLPARAPPLYSAWMASSEVDQKFLGHFAKSTSIENNYLSSFLFRTLGLSVLISEYLLSARRAKSLDPSRSPQDRYLVHHILWLAREGLVMVEQYILPMIDHYLELKVLAYKLRASFYHIFVLFHNNPPVNYRLRRPRADSNAALYPEPLTPRIRASESPQRRQRSPAISLGGPVGAKLPPGLSVPTPNDRDLADASFLLPLTDYTRLTTNAFVAANVLAESLLPGSHPIRLSVKVEYVAYLYDCLNEREQSRRLARRSIREVYEATEGMDDESFEDAAELVGILGRMMRRGLSQAQKPTQPQQVFMTRSPVQSSSGIIPTTTARASPPTKTAAATSTARAKQPRSPDSKGKAAATTTIITTSATTNTNTSSSQSSARARRKAGATAVNTSTSTSTGGESSGSRRPISRQRQQQQQPSTWV